MARLRPAALSWRRVEGEIVVLDLTRWVYLGVNRSGASLWPRLVEGASAEQLAQVLVDAHGIDPDQAALDTESFLTTLRSHSLLEE